MGLIANNVVPWSDHHTLKAQFSVPVPPSIGGGHIYARPQRLMESERFLNVLRDPKPPSDSLNEMVYDWHSHLSTAIVEIAPQCPLNSRHKPAPWFTDALRDKKKELR